MNAYSDKITQAKSHRKQAEKTVGLTITPSLSAETRKRNLNISRITEPTLLFIIEYIQARNESFSLSSGSLLPSKEKAKRTRGYPPKSLFYLDLFA